MWSTEIKWLQQSAKQAKRLQSMWSHSSEKSERYSYRLSDSDPLSYHLDERHGNEEVRNLMSASMEKMRREPSWIKFWSVSQWEKKKWKRTSSSGTVWHIRTLKERRSMNAWSHKERISDNGGGREKKNVIEKEHNQEKKSLMRQIGTWYTDSKKPRKKIVRNDKRHLCRKYLVIWEANLKGLQAVQKI